MMYFTIPLNRCLAISQWLTVCLLLMLPLLTASGRAAAFGTGPFVTTWKTDNPGSSTATQIEIPTTGTGYNYSVYWEELNNSANQGSVAGVTGNHIINFPAAGTYRVEISGDFPRIYFNNAGDKAKLLTVEQWGGIAWSSMERAFYGCLNLTVPATDAPDLRTVTDMNSMFRDATSFNGDISNWNVSMVSNMGNLFFGATIFNGDIGSWDVSSVTNMGNMLRGTSFNKNISNWNVSNVSLMNQLFMNTPSFNQDISSWDVGNVTNMAAMFNGATNFNQDLSNWNTSKVTLMHFMFQSASNFNGDISSWDVSSVTNMSFMFRGAGNFNQDLSNWNVSNVTLMNHMFQGARSFNQLINSWNVSSVADMSYMFSGATGFNGDISSWNVSSVTKMDYMFQGARSFNGDLSNWNVNKVTSMNSVFRGAISFNGDIGGWDVSNVADMQFMFYGAENFNRDLRLWNVSRVTKMNSMLTYSGISTVNYDRLLRGWLVNGVQNGVFLHAGGLEYCKGSDARATLIGTYGWTISEDTQNCSHTITFGPLAGKIYGDPAFELSATSSLGLPVSYSSSDKTVVTISGNTVTIVGAGTATITASQPGTADYEAAAPVEQILTVNKAEQTITFEALATKAYGDATFELTATASSGLPISYTSSDETVATISGSTVTIVGAGSAVVTATQAGNENYNAAVAVAQTLTVNKLQQTIILETIGDKMTDAAPFEVVASASSGLAVDLEVNGPATISGNTITLTGTAGTVTVTATQAGDRDYAAAEPVVTTFEVLAPTGLADLEKLGVRVFPNPATDFLIIEVQDKQGLQLSLFDLNGKMRLKMVNASQKLDVSILESGVYFLQVRSSGKNAYYRIVKQ